MGYSQTDVKMVKRWYEDKEKFDGFTPEQRIEVLSVLNEDKQCTPENRLKYIAEIQELRDKYWRGDIRVGE